MLPFESIPRPSGVSGSLAMTQALNCAGQGGAAAAKNNAQPIRQKRILRCLSFSNPDWAKFIPPHGSSDCRLDFCFVIFQNYDHVSEFRARGCHIQHSIVSARRNAALVLAAGRQSRLQGGSRARARRDTADRDNNGCDASDRRELVRWTGRDAAPTLARWLLDS